MEKIPSMVNMARSNEEKKDSIAVNPVDAVPTYPYGLCLSLCEDELEKLGLEQDDLQVGDMIHFHALATVTSTSENSNASGSNCRAELQIQYMSAEDEDEENEEEEVQEKEKVNRPSKLYKS